MKTCLRVIAGFIPFLLLACGGGAASTWQSVTADDNSYTVSMPGQPKAEAQSIDVPQGKIKLKMQELAFKDVNYAVGYSEYPAGFLATIGPDANAMFNKSRDATVKQRQATVVADTEGKVGDFPSRTLVTTFAMPDNSDNVTMKQVMILANGRMYITQTIVLSKAPAQATADATKFHDSLVLNVK